MAKHCLSLTYEPKIPAVRNGSCTQTIRPLGSVEKHVGDWVMFHGWSDKPYRSPWSWRTSYWELEYTASVKFYPGQMFEVFTVTEPVAYPKEKMDEIARRDWFSDYEVMFQQFRLMYKKKLESMIFQILRWDPKKAMDVV